MADAYDLIDPDGELESYRRTTLANLEIQRVQLEVNARQAELRAADDSTITPQAMATRQQVTDLDGRIAGLRSLTAQPADVRQQCADMLRGLAEGYERALVQQLDVSAHADLYFDEQNRYAQEVEAKRIALDCRAGLAACRAMLAEVAPPSTAPDTEG